jgi:hypothetical protein
MNTTVLHTPTEPIVDTAWYRLRCTLRIHPWGRWQIATMMLVSGKRISVRYHECTTCGWPEIKPL